MRVDPQDGSCLQPVTQSVCIAIPTKALKKKKKNLKKQQQQNTLKELEQSEDELLH